MDKIREIKKSAAICYCLLAESAGSAGMEELLCWCQETFEKAGFRELYQGFAVGRKMPCAIPLRRYPVGFCAELDEEENGNTFLENLVLSYGMFLNFKENIRSDMEYFLILLMTEDSIEQEEELHMIIENYLRLKKKLNINVCCLRPDEKPDDIIGNNFIDVFDKNGIRSILSRL